MSTGPFLESYERPQTDLVDPNATSRTRDIWTTIKRLNSGALPKGAVAIGQHLDGVFFHTRKPVSILEAEVYNGVQAATPAVIGSEMGAFITYLDKPNNGGADVINTHIKGLVADSNAGRLITMQWHARNPMSGGPVKDHTGQDHIADILDESTSTGAAWLVATNKAIGILQRLAAKGVTVAWRPFHEVNISSFWWGKCDPALYRAMWSQMQRRFKEAELHNIIWLYGPNNRDRDAVLNPMTHVPFNYDMFTLDSYWYRTSLTDVPLVPLNIDDYTTILTLNKPFALAEVDVLNDKVGNYPPSTVTDAINKKMQNCAWAAFWWTYQGTDQGASADKQSINDLQGHETWWANSVDGTLPTTRLPQPSNLKLVNDVLSWSYVNSTAKFQFRPTGAINWTETAVKARSATLAPEWSGVTSVQIRAVSPQGTAFSAVRTLKSLDT